MQFTKPFKFYSMILLGLKKITNFFVDVMNACDRVRRKPRGYLSVGRQTYVRIKSWQDTHVLWVKLKASLELKSDKTLGCHLLASGKIANSSRQDSQVKESIGGKWMKVELSVHGTSKMSYTVFRVSKLLTHYIYIQYIWTAL